MVSDNASGVSQSLFKIKGVLIVEAVVATIEEPFLDTEAMRVKKEEK